MLILSQNCRVLKTSRSAVPWDYSSLRFLLFVPDTELPLSKYAWSPGRLDGKNGKNFLDPANWVMFPTFTFFFFPVCLSLVLDGCP